MMKKSVICEKICHLLKKKKLHIQLPFDPAIALLGIFPREMKI